jgi:hypothetical protein
MKRINFMATEEEHELVRQASDRMKRSMTEIMRELIRKYLKESN